MKPTRVLWSSSVKDGLAYINPLPTNHRLYTIREMVEKAAQFIDRWLFR